MRWRVRHNGFVLTDCRQKTHAIQLGPHGVTLELKPGSLPVSTDVSDARAAADEVPADDVAVSD